jgi:hypothetical protein
MTSCVRRSLWPVRLGLTGAVATVLACVPPRLVVTVNAGAGMNQGLPMFVVARAVDQAKYLSEPYATVANQVTSPDSSVIQTAQIYPGRNSQLLIKTPDKTPLAVYFLFTDPGIRWRMYLEQPMPAKCTISVEANEIQEATCQ